jgi:hypothetical protein
MWRFVLCAKADHTARYTPLRNSARHVSRTERSISNKTVAKIARTARNGVAVIIDVRFFAIDFFSPYAETKLPSQSAENKIIIMLQDKGEFFPLNITTS